MFTLVKQQVADDLIETVNARDLHKFLGSNRQFSNWITYQIEAFGFKQGIDFITINNSEYSPPRKDYHITLDMAKELSMVERNAKGKEARKYFIECERIAKEATAATDKIPQSYAEALLAAYQKELEKEQLAKQLTLAKPKVDFYDAVSTSEDLIQVGVLAKILNSNGIDIGQLRMFNWLRDNGYLVSVGKQKNLPTQKSLDLGLFKVVESSFTVSGVVRLNQTTYVTIKGQQYFIRKFLAVCSE